MVSQKLLFGKNGVNRKNLQFVSYLIIGLLILQGPVMVLTESFVCFCHIKKITSGFSLCQENTTSSAAKKFSKPLPSCCSARKTLGNNNPSQKGSPPQKKGCCCLKKRGPVQAQETGGVFSLSKTEGKQLLLLISICKGSVQPSLKICPSLPPPDTAPSLPIQILSSVILLL